SLGMSLVFLAVALQESLISAPYTVNCRDAAIGARRFLGGAFLNLVMLALGAAAALLGSAALAGVMGWGSGGMFAVLAAVTPCILVREFARRIDYADLQPRSAVLLSAGVAALQLSLTVGLWWAGLLNVVSCLAVLGVASLGGGVSWFFAARRRMEFDPRAGRDTFAANWPLARWIFATQVSEIVRVQAFPWLIAMLLDTGSAGVYAACLAVSALASPLLIALSNIMVPQIVHVEEQGGAAAVSVYVRRATSWILLCLGAYCAVLCGVSAWIVPWFYGATFQGSGHPLVVLALAQLFLGLNVPSARALMVLRRPDQVFWSQLGSFVLTVLVAFPMVRGLGIVGAAYALLLGAIVKCASTYWWYRALVARELGGAASAAEGRPETAIAGRPDADSAADWCERRRRSPGAAPGIAVLGGVEGTS
ncbi:MAG TPA: polysaccharide biosynthesis C-terminal domain-containing protein, partial [Lacipirellulaceae bacterium]|nr:polysaccharide biosynthesis C-terminal domain-containing protein [Lacipirellulaceae bacterium]